MIIWKGFGILVPVVTFLILLGTEVTVESAFSDDSYYQLHGWPMFLGFLVSAAAIWLLVEVLEKQNADVSIDELTGEEAHELRSDSFFFIPMRHWPKILVGIGILGAIATHVAPELD